jgi:iron complex outermembrane receptor protein
VPRIRFVSPSVPCLPLNPARGVAGRVLFIENDIMTFASSRRYIGAWKPLALVSALSTLTIAPAYAQANDDKTLAPVVVTASRFANDPAFAPIGASVITSEQIREAGVGNVNEAIRKIGGVYGRQNLYGTQDYSLDLRGFGATSDNNMVVLLDGVRLSENEQAQALLASIPIESVERIEIVRGGSSVLYGEGATGGTIQVITKRPQAGQMRGSLVGSVGNYGHRALSASVAKGLGNLGIDATISTTHDDNFRRNNDAEQNNFSGGIQWSANGDRLGARIDLARQNNRFPGSLTYAQYQADPRQASTPNDFGSFDTDRFTLFGEKRLGAFELAADLSHRTRSSEFFAFGALTTYDSKVTQFSPRIRHLSKSGTVSNEFVAGLDIARWSRIRNSSFAKDDATQRSEAFYFRDELKVGDARVALGARHEQFDKETVDPVPFNANYRKSDSLNAWSLEGAYALRPAVNVFAKIGTSYRIPNVDDSAFLSAPLNPQTSHDTELGASLGDVNQGKLTVRMFRHRLKNEIMYDASRFANANLDPTRREGIEIEASARVAPAFTLSATLQHVSAKFTGGRNAGNEVVLVPNNTATLRLNWLPGTGHSADVGVQWVDSQRYGGDFANTCSARIPSFATVDARYAIRAGAWEFAVSGANLTDEKYFTNAFGACRSGIYPDPGRMLKISARMDF